MFRFFSVTTDAQDAQRSKNRRRRASLLALLLLLLLLLFVGSRVILARQGKGRVTGGGFKPLPVPVAASSDSGTKPVEMPATSPADANPETIVKKAEEKPKDACIPFCLFDCGSRHGCYGIAAYTDGEYIYHLAYSEEPIYYFPSTTSYTAGPMTGGKMAIIRLRAKGLSYEAALSYMGKNNKDSIYQSVELVAESRESHANEFLAGNDIVTVTRKLTYLPFLRSGYMQYIPVFPLSEPVCDTTFTDAVIK